MQKRTNGIGQFISYLAYMSTAAWAETQPDNGRPVYPYTLATTKAERMAYVERRQARHKPKTGYSARKNRLAKRARSMGPSRKMFVARTDGGNGP